ncbi:putative cell division cycle protein 48 -like protein [Capsicum annuum]|nr:putative cell division cycle protein 48 -like protein [Capsicum annuum]
MISNSKPFSIIFSFVGFLILASIFGSVISDPTHVQDAKHHLLTNQTFKPKQELLKLKRLRTYLRKSPDGDLIDCVLSHLQPAFDHPHLKGMKPLVPPKRPKANESTDSMTDTSSFQLWTVSGESCPEGTVPIRRTTGKDVMRASTLQRFGRKIIRGVRRDTMSSDHEHAVAFVNGEEYYGAKASISVWTPKVTDQYEFSLSQLWIISGTFGDDLNTIEAGWQVSPELYGDIYPRFFTYWTSDAYQTTGCYNLLCTGFVQTNNRIAMGAAISPTSTSDGSQLDIDIMIWKPPFSCAMHAALSSNMTVGTLISSFRPHLSLMECTTDLSHMHSLLASWIAIISA